MGRRQIQPKTGVRLDRSNPLARQPAFLYVATARKELVNAINYTFAGSTPPVLNGTPRGVGTKHTSGAATVSYLSLGTPTGPSVDLATVPATFVGAFYANSTTGVAIAERNDGNSSIGWVFGYTSTGSGLGFIKTYSSTNVRKSITETVKPGLNTLVVTFDGGSTPTGCNVYLNGVLGTVAGSATGSGTTSTDSGQTLYIGRNTFDTSASHDGTILMAGAFRRIWSEAEIREFHRNPWQLFAGPIPPPAALQLAAGGDVSDALTGVAATGAVGATGVTRTDDITGNVGTGSPGTVALAHTQPLTSTAATGAVGTATALAESNVALTGVQATGTAGGAGLTHTQPLTGNAATGSPGTVTPALSVPLTGAQATGAVGTVTALAASNVALTGTAATGAVGTISVAHVQPLTGVQATGSPGAVAPSTVIGLTGTAATGAVGTVSVTAANEYPLSGVQATGAVGSVAPALALPLTGNVATGQLGSVTATVSKALTGAQATGAVGTVASALTIGLTGAQATGQVGTVTAVVTGNVTVGLSGTQATGAAGTLTALGGDVGDTSTGGGQDPSETPRRALPEQTQTIYPRRSKTAATPAPEQIPEPISAKAAIQPAIGGKTLAIESAGELALSQLRVLELQSRQAAIAARAAEMAQMQQAHAIALAEIEAAALMATAMRRREDEELLLLLLA